MANARKTYFLAPTRDTPPAAAIQLGQLITDPAWPEENILNSSILKIPAELGPFTTIKKDVETSHSHSHDTSPGIFAEFLQSILGVGADLAVHYKRESESGLGMAAMETVYFNSTAAYVREAVQADEVRSILRKKKWLVLKRPVYMITGLKIARGPNAVTKLFKEKGIHAQIGVNLAPVTGGVPVTVGPTLGHERGKGEDMSWSEGDDFVLAYRLRKIVLKQGGEVKSDMYTKGALYSDVIDIRDPEGEGGEYENMDVEEEEYDGEDGDFDLKDAVDEEGADVRLALPQD